MYASFDPSVNMVVRALGPAALLAKCDIRSAFWLLPVQDCRILTFCDLPLKEPTLIKLYQWVGHYLVLLLSGLAVFFSGVTGVWPLWHPAIILHII